MNTYEIDLGTALLVVLRIDENDWCCVELNADGKQTVLGADVWDVKGTNKKNHCHHFVNRKNRNGYCRNPKTIMYYIDS